MASPGKKSYPLRIDPGVWNAIARLAVSDMRSINAQIEFMLREELHRRGIRLPEGTSVAPSDSDSGMAD